MRRSAEDAEEGKEKDKKEHRGAETQRRACGLRASRRDAWM